MLPNSEKISQAAERISPYIHRTPVITSQRINKIFNAKIYFKNRKQFDEAWKIEINDEE